MHGERGTQVAYSQQSPTYRLGILFTKGQNYTQRITKWRETVYSHDRVWGKGITTSVSEGQGSIVTANIWSRDVVGNTEG